MWTVICEPVGGDDVATGLALVLTNGEERRMVSRVAFARRNSKNPKIPFERQLQTELDKAEEAIVTLNELDEEFDRIRDDAAHRARERLREVLGPDKVAALQ